MPLSDRSALAAPFATVPEVTVATVVLPASLTAKVTVPSATAAADGLLAVTVAVKLTVAACP